MLRRSPKVAIRTDASTRIGSGHVMRCLVLADELREAGADIVFVCRDLPGNLMPVIRSRGHRVAVLPTLATSESHEISDWRQDVATTITILQSCIPFDWIVVDHYLLDWRWENVARSLGSKIMVIDDLANRLHDCDLLLDQNYYRDLEKRYRGLAPPRCKLFLGPRFALLRKAFRNQLPRRRNWLRVERLFIFFGGADRTRETEKVLRVLQLPDFSSLTADVVVGLSNPRLDAITRVCAGIPNVTLHVQTDRMAELMTNADLAIGAGGATTWERMKCELPALTVVTAPNQRDTTIDLAEAGAIWYLGLAEQLTSADYERAIRDALRQPARVAAIAQTAAALMDKLNGDNEFDGIYDLVQTMVEGRHANEETQAFFF